MRASLQDKIAPTTNTKAMTFNEVDSGSPTAKVQINDKLDFKSLLLNSNAEVKKKHETQKSGDLSGAKNYEEFLSNLNKNSEKEKLPRNTLGKDDFLKLFVTQLQNQDPLNPKDGTEMASQLAQFNGLEQMLNMNSALGRVENTMADNKNIQLINYVGKEASLENGFVGFHKNGISKANFTLEQPMDGVLLEVKNAAEQVVFKKDMGSLNPGNYPIEWDGKNSEGQSMPHGFYKVSVKSVGEQGLEQAIKVSSTAIIDGVDLNEKSKNLSTDVGKLSIGEIKAFKLKEEPLPPVALPTQEPRAPLATKDKAADQERERS